MKKQLLLIIGLLAVSSPQVPAQESSYALAVEDTYPGLLAELKSKIKKFEKRGNYNQVRDLNYILNGLYGKGGILSVRRAYLLALEKQESVRKKKNRIFWNQVTSMLEINQGLIFTEMNTDSNNDFDVSLTRLMINTMNFSETEYERNIFYSVLMGIFGYNGYSKPHILANHIVHLRNLMEEDKRPDRWNELIDELETYALDSYEEKSFMADVRTQNAYNYDIYDTETGEKIGSIKAGSGQVYGDGGLTSTEDIKWALKFAKGAAGNTDYLSYGVWSRSRVPVGREDDNYNERQVVVFYDGDNPVENIDRVTGQALYQGDTVGVYHSNTTEDHEIARFTGVVHLKVDFDKNHIRGKITNLSSSELPSRITLVKTDFDSKGNFNGEVTSNSNPDVKGEWNGGFFNQGGPTDAPEHIGGSYSLSTGIRKNDLKVQGAFGTSKVFEHPSK